MYLTSGMDVVNKLIMKTIKIMFFNRQEGGGWLWG